MFGSILNTARVLRAPALLFSENVLFQQARTAMVLSRRWQPLLRKKDGPKKRLKSKHFVYDLVENIEQRKKVLIDVLLTSYVEEIGIRGDIIKTTPVHAYNAYLLPGLGVYNTPENREKYKRRVDDPNQEQHSSAYTNRCVRELKGLNLLVEMNKHNPWVVQPWHIRTALRKANYHVLDDNCIKLPDQKITGPDMNKENKEFFVTVIINNCEKVRVRCRLHHITTILEEQVPLESPEGVLLFEDEPSSEPEAPEKH